MTLTGGVGAHSSAREGEGVRAGLAVPGWAGFGTGFRPSWLRFTFFFVLFLFPFLFSVLNFIN